MAAPVVAAASAQPSVQSGIPAGALAPAVGPPLSKQEALELYLAVFARLSHAIRSFAITNPSFPPANVTEKMFLTLPVDHELFIALKSIRTVGERVAQGEQRQDVCGRQIGWLLTQRECPSVPLTSLKAL